MEIPSSKHQIPKKSQVPSSKLQIDGSGWASGDFGVPLCQAAFYGGFCIFAKRNGSGPAYRSVISKRQDPNPMEIPSSKHQKNPFAARTVRNREAVRSSIKSLGRIGTMVGVVIHPERTRQSCNVTILGPTLSCKWPWLTRAAPRDGQGVWLLSLMQVSFGFEARSVGNREAVPASIKSLGRSGLWLAW
jgi:hypothetical protein